MAFYLESLVALGSTLFRRGKIPLVLFGPGVDNQGAGQFVVEGLPPVVNQNPEVAQEEDGREGVA